MLSIIIAFIVMIWVGVLITKKYKAQAVLFLGGMVLMLIAVYTNLGEILPEKERTGIMFFDMFEFIKKTLSSRAAGLGLNIMAVGGFARYMEHIGASKALVKLTINPLRKLKSPYIVMSAAWVIGMTLGLFINSASGLAMLLMVTVFPILIQLGVSRLSACAVIATTLCMDWSPGDTGSLLAAQISGMSITTYWTQYQVPTALCVIVVVAILHYFVQQWFDKREGHVHVALTAEELEKDKETMENLPPALYAVLPTIPLFLILFFSDIWVSWGKADDALEIFKWFATIPFLQWLATIKMDIVKAMLISLFIAMVVEYIRKRNAKEVMEGIQSFFDGLGMQMANVVTLIVAGETFARGLQSIGAIDAIIKGSQNMGFSGFGMVLVMVAIIGFSAIIMGSGNAPFFAFAALTPTVAAKMGLAPVLMIMPMHFIASIARNLSPITAVIVVTSSLGGISPFDLVKRTAIPMVGAAITMLAANYILFH